MEFSFETIELDLWCFNGVLFVVYSWIKVSNYNNFTTIAMIMIMTSTMMTMMMMMMMMMMMTTTTTTTTTMVMLAAQTMCHQQPFINEQEFDIDSRTTACHVKHKSDWLNQLFNRSINYSIAQSLGVAMVIKGCFHSSRRQPSNRHQTMRTTWCVYI